MKTVLIALVVIAAYCLTACGGSDDNEPEQRCTSASPAAEGMDKVPATPCRAEAQ